MADRIVQLTDEDDNNIFPAAGTMPTGAITTNMLQNNSVTSDKIDFATFGRTVFGAGGTTLTYPQLTIQSPNNGIFMVLWGFQDNWGYGGQAVGLDMNTPTGLTQIFHQHPYVARNDTVARDASGIAFYSGAIKGNSYTFSISQFGAFGGGETPVWMTAIWLPGN